MRFKLDPLSPNGISLSGDNITITGGGTTTSSATTDGALTTSQYADIKRQGFTNLTETSIGFDGTNTFTLTSVGASWTYYRDGVKYTISGNKTATLSATPPATAGFYYIYIDNTTGTLTASTDGWTLLDSKVPVATVNWNNSLTPKYWLTDERHTILLDSRMQYYLHTTDGAKAVSSPTISGYTLNSDVNANKTFAISASTLLDQDMKHDLASVTQPNGTDTDYVVWYRTGASTWAWKKSNMPFVYNVGNTNDWIQWDNAGTMTDATGGAGGNTRWLNSYLLMTNITGDTRYMFVPGRAIFTSLATAQSEDVASFTWTGLPIAEAVIAYKLTWSTVTSTSQGQCRLVAVQKVNLATTTNLSSGAGTDHNTLSNLQGGTSNEYYHLTSAEATKVANTVRAITFTVAANNATANEKAQADYVCDGTADDVQIQAALDALPTAGGTIQLSTGQFNIAASIALPTKVFSLIGAGMDATRLRTVNSGAFDMFTYSGVSNVTFNRMVGMTLDGNRANGATGNGINLNATGKFWDARWQDLFILNFTGMGFYTNDAHHNVFDHVIVEYCGASATPWVTALKLDGGDLPYMTNCLIKLNEGRGMACGAYGLSVSNTIFSQNGEVGLLIYADDCTIVGCKFDNNSYLSSGTYPSLQIANDRVIVSATSFWGSDSRPKYCIQTDATAANTTLANNVYAGYATSALNDGGTSTVSTSGNNTGDQTLAGLGGLPLAGGTMTGDIQLGETAIKLDATLSGDETWSGITIAGTLGATIASGDLCYLNNDDGRWELVDANVSDGYDKQLGICLDGGGDGDATTMLIYGKVRSAAFPAFTVGSPLYMSETAGDITHTKPTTSGAVVRTVGFALTAEDLLFNPSNDFVELA